MSRLIALAVVFGGLYWLWQRWQRSASISQNTRDTHNPERLTQCPRCDAMLPESLDQQAEVAESCDQGDRCPLKQSR